MLRTIAVDDEKNARINLVNMVNTYCSNIEIVATAENVAEGVKKINELKPDLVLLDVDMPDGTGFDLLKKLMPVDFMVIFITAYSEHALNAIKFNALDFLVKPLDPEEFLLAINKAVKNIAAQNKKIEKLINVIDGEESLKLALSTTDSVFFIDPSEIVRIEADSNYSIFFLIDGRKIMVSKPLKEFAGILEGRGFFRCHQSHLINLAYLKEYKKRDGGFVLMSNGESVAMSSRKKEKLLNAFKAYKK